jgi:PD-(D/E)XK nuclease superfamily
MEYTETHIAVHEALKRLSHSSISLLRTCPQKYKLRKMYGKLEDEESEDLAFGKAVGYGIQQLLIGRPIERIYLEILSSWSRDIIDTDVGEERKKKTIWHAYYALELFERRHIRNILANYEVATFAEKKAIELGFRIKIGSGFSYRGFVDVVLVHKLTRQLLVLEIKTTASKYVLPAKYQNSDQALGYSLMCDYIARHSSAELGSNYQVMYFVYMSTRQEYEVLNFTKSHSMRAQWIQDMLLEVEKVKLYQAAGYWPRHGSACGSYNRACDFIGICHMSDEALLAGANPEVKPEEDEDFVFNVSLLDLIESQMQLNQEELDKMLGPQEKLTEEIET